MSAHILLPTFAAINENEKKEKERLEKLYAHATSEKILYLCVQAANWKNDEDIATAYQNMLNNRLWFNSLHTHEAQRIFIGDFFAFLTLYKDKESIATLIEKQCLFEKTLKKHPYFIRPFIEATGCKTSSIGYGQNSYLVERDIFQHRQEIFIDQCHQQKKPVCLMASSDDFRSYGQRSFLEMLTEKTHPALRNALAGDVVVPATIMASGDKRFVKLYRQFLEKPTFLYTPEKTKIKETFEKAEELSKTSEYQNLFIEPCPAIITKFKYGIIPYKTIDTSQNYECPIIKKLLEKQNSR